MILVLENIVYVVFHGSKPFDLKTCVILNFKASYKFNKSLSFDVFGNDIFDTIGFNTYTICDLNKT